MRFLASRLTTARSSPLLDDSSAAPSAAHDSWRAFSSAALRRYWASSASLASARARVSSVVPWR